MKKTLSAGALMALATVAWAQIPALPSNAAYLAGNCANCHGTTGNAKGGMPSLAGQPKAYLIERSATASARGRSCPSSPRATRTRR